MPYGLPALGKEEESFSIINLGEITFQNVLLNIWG